MATREELLKVQETVRKAWNEKLRTNKALRAVVEIAKKENTNERECNQELG